MGKNVDKTAHNIDCFLKAWWDMRFQGDLNIHKIELYKLEYCKGLTYENFSWDIQYNANNYDVSRNSTVGDL